MQIHFNGTNFINAWLTQRILSVLPVAQPVVGEMEMQCCQFSNSADPFSDFFSLQKSAQTLFSFRESPALSRARGLAVSGVRTPLSLSLSLCLYLLCSARCRDEQHFQLNTDIMLLL